MSKNKPIGIFDSGVGGLTVLKKLAAALPGEDYLYFGDTARVPYGEKTREQLIEFVVEILNWYKYKNAKAVLMACNTSSAVVLPYIKDNYDFPVFGLIQPTAQYISNLNIKKIGIIATSATIKSKAYSKAILNYNSDKEIYEIACPGLVEIVESNKINTSESKVLINNYINPLLEKGIEKIILGCTHYPYLKDVIVQLSGNPDLLVDPADYLVKEVQDKFKKLDLLGSSDCGTRKYFVSANPDKFVEVGNNFYSDCIKAELADINIRSFVSKV